MSGRLRLAKAHGLGNDFLLVERSVAPAAGGEWVRRLCDRHVGVGADGVIVFEILAHEAAVVMRLFNADGGEVEISGNGLRCLSSYVVSQGWLPLAHDVRTGAGPREAVVEQLEGGQRFRVRTDLGEPILDSTRIPMALDAPRDRVVDLPLEVEGQSLQVTATSMGNPHCALFVDSPPDDETLSRLGRALEVHPRFPNRTNVEFVTVRALDRLQVRFWERGVGLTQASGTGAASAAVAGVIAGRSGRRVAIECDGGRLEVEWPEGGRVVQIGETEVVFEGDWLLPPEAGPS